MISAHRQASLSWTSDILCIKQDLQTQIHDTDKLLNPLFFNIPSSPQAGSKHIIFVVNVKILWSALIQEKT